MHSILYRYYNEYKSYLSMYCKGLTDNWSINEVCHWFLQLKSRYICIVVNDYIAYTIDRRDYMIIYRSHTIEWLYSSYRVVWYQFHFYQILRIEISLWNCGRIKYGICIYKEANVSMYNFHIITNTNLIWEYWWRCCTSKRLPLCKYKSRILFVHSFKEKCQFSKSFYRPCFKNISLKLILFGTVIPLCDL